MRHGHISSHQVRCRVDGFFKHGFIPIFRLGGHDRPSAAAISTTPGPVALIEINGQIGSCPGEPGEANDSVSTAAPGVDCCLPGATCICADQPVPRDPCNTAECGR